MNQKCFACGNDVWEYIGDDTNELWEEIEIWECSICGEIEKIDKEDK